MSGLLEGKRGIILGVANKRSLAWAAARSLAAHGAQVALTYQSERLREGVEKLAAELGEDTVVLPCDVIHLRQIDKLATSLEERMGNLDFLVHSIAFAPQEDLKGRFTETTRKGFHRAMDVSVYSLVALCDRLRPLMTGRDASVVTLTYMGSTRVIPNYNLMGVAKAALESTVRYLSWDLGGESIRVNAVSPGPVRTLSASAVGDFVKILDHVVERAPMKRNIDAADVGETVAFLCSNGARSISGEILHIDSGMHCMGA
ncbi:MAG: enoyl-ACP reductase FabI [Planctomycetota bacterium]